MNEIITANGVQYTTKNVDTGINSISFTFTDPVDDAEATFRNVKALTVGDGKGTTYGQYPDVEFDSITTSANGDVTITMHILSETERQIRQLQASQAEFQVSQAEQDEVLAEILYGGGEA